MLRQISLELWTENKLQDTAKEFGTELSIKDCKSFDKTGMALLLELKGEPDAARRTVAAFRKLEGIRQAVEGNNGGSAVPVLLVLDRPSICSASNDSAIICLECPMSAERQPASWKFIVRKTSDLRQILTKLNHDGVRTRIVDISPLNQKAILTGRQREILSTAVTNGYFEFPRRISMTSLSQLVGVKPSTLSEILRSAERKVMSGASDVPIFEE